MHERSSGVPNPLPNPTRTTPTRGRRSRGSFTRSKGEASRSLRVAASDAGFEVSRLARNNKDWNQLLDLRSVTNMPSEMVTGFATRPCLVIV